MSSGASEPPPPARIQWEIDRFDDVDLPVAASTDDEGRWNLSFERRFAGAAHTFRVVFPPHHPEIAPLMYGPPGLLQRHQNSGSGSLCLVDNEVNWWRTWFSAVELVRQLDTLLGASEQGEDAVVAQEAPMAEPLTGHLAYRDDVTVLVPDALLDDELAATSGTFRLRRINEHLHVVTELRDSTRNLIASAERAVSGLTKDEGAIGGWIELADAPGVADLTAMLKAASSRALTSRETWKGKSKPGKRAPKKRFSGVTGVTFFEEGPGHGERRRTWVFAETTRGLADVAWAHDRPIRAQAISQRQRDQRIPELVSLYDVRIVMIGAGSLGSEIAVELAKAGAGRIDVFDGDIYEPGNSVRHVLPVTAAGRNKAEAVVELCRAINPFCDARGHRGDVGHPTGDATYVDDLIENADLIVETTGSHAVTRMLRRRAGAVGAPVVTAALSMGGHGGRVVVLRAGGPCWDCFLHAQDTGQIPIPDEGPRHDTTPFGCSHPAAACAGFDVAQVAAFAARMSIQALQRTAYPPLDHDWVVMNFRPGSDAITRGSLTENPACSLATH